MLVFSTGKKEQLPRNGLSLLCGNDLSLRGEEHAEYLNTIAGGPLNELEKGNWLLLFSLCYYYHHH